MSILNPHLIINIFCGEGVEEIVEFIREKKQLVSEYDAKLAFKQFSRHVFTTSHYAGFFAESTIVSQFLDMRVS